MIRRQKLSLREGQKARTLAACRTASTCTPIVCRRTVESNVVNGRGGATVSAPSISDASEAAHNVNIFTKRKVMSIVSYVGRYEASAVTRVHCFLPFLRGLSRSCEIMLITKRQRVRRLKRHWPTSVISRGRSAGLSDCVLFDMQSDKMRNLRHVSFTCWHAGYSEFAKPCVALHDGIDVQCHTQMWSSLATFYPLHHSSPMMHTSYSSARLHTQSF